MPFITEELYNAFKTREDGDSISTSKFPEFNLSLVDVQAESEMEFIQDIVTAIRNIRGEMNIVPGKQFELKLKTNKVTENQIAYIQKLAKVSSVEFGENIEKPKAVASAVVKGCDIFIPLEGLIDLDVEKARLQKEITRLEGSLKGVIAKLSNEKFVSGAPKDVVEREQAKKNDWESNIAKLKEMFESLG
jgi:valyl-tRNA synthetase